jgi:hypothetical protein
MEELFDIAIIMVSITATMVVSIHFIRFCKTPASELTVDDNNDYNNDQLTTTGTRQTIF